MNRIQTMLLVLGGLAGILPGQLPLWGSRPPQERFAQGVEKFNAGDYSGAGSSFQKLLNAGAGDFETAATLMLMKSEYHSGNHERARELGRSFLRQYPHSIYRSEIYLCFGDMAVDQRRPGQALDMYLRSRRLATAAKDRDVIDRRLVKVVKWNVPSAYSEGLQVAETNSDNRKILLLAYALGQLGSGQQDLAANSLNQMTRSELPEIYRPVYDNLVRWSYRPGHRSITVGVILPLSGNDMEMGQAYFRGLQRALKELAAQGLHINIVFVDNYGDEVETVQAVKKLSVNDQVLTIIGPLKDVNVISAASTAQEARVPIIIPLSTRDNLTTLGKYVFQINSTLSWRGRLAGRYAAGLMDLDSLAVLAPADEFGHILVDAFAAEVDALGKKLIAIEWYTGIPEDIGRQFKALRKAAFKLVRTSEFDEYLGMEIDSLDAMFAIPNADFFNIPAPEKPQHTKTDSTKIILATIQGLYLPIHAGHIPYVGTQFSAYNLKTRLIGNENWLDYDVVTQELIGPHIEGMTIISNYFSSNANMAQSERTEPDLATQKLFDQGYDCGRLLAVLFEVANPTRDSVRETLAGMPTFQGMSQYVNFTESEHNVNTALRAVMYKNGQFNDLGYFQGDSLISTGFQAP